MRVARITEYFKFFGMKMFTFNHLNMFNVNCKISEQHQHKEENKLLFIEFLTFLQIVVHCPEALSAMLKLKHKHT